MAPTVSTSVSVCDDWECCLSHQRNVFLVTPYRRSDAVGGTLFPVRLCLTLGVG
jgi:hypothetical protein